MTKAWQFNPGNFSLHPFIVVAMIIVLSSSSSAQIKLAWDPNTEPDLGGYKVYYGTTSRSYRTSINVGNVTSYTLNGLTEGVTYYIAVTAYDRTNNESGFSNEVSGKITEAVGTPVALSGPTQGNSGLAYSYTAGGSFSNLGHPVQYQYDWVGDRSGLSPWGGPTQTRTWNDLGVYGVYVRARCAVHTSLVSNWFGPLRVAILNHPSTQEIVTDYYLSILHRSPEAGGVETWSAEIKRIVAMEIDIKEGFIAVGSAFFNSAEYLAGNKKDSEFVRDLYLGFLQRAPSQAEIDNWVGYLRGGLSRNAILKHFCFSLEFGEYVEEIFEDGTSRPENNLINDFYRGVLNRLPDSTGFYYWLGWMRKAQCEGFQPTINAAYQIASIFFNGPEYSKRNRTNSGYVEDLYDALLHRGVLTGELNYWKGVLNAGSLDREEVLRYFIESIEFQARIQDVLSAGCKK